MPFNAQQLAIGANYQLDVFRRNDPVDQVNTERPFLAWLMANRQEAPGGNQYLVEQIYKSNDSNYQNYFGADQVSYNQRDPVRQAKYPWYNFHDGFGLDEDTLAANGIILTDDREAVASGAEKLQLTNLLKTHYMALKEGAQEKLNEELLLDGSLSSKACPGLDHLISTTPTTGVVGGLDAATYNFWRNEANTALAANALIDGMEKSWRECTRRGKMKPNFIVAGTDFCDAYRQQAGQTVNRQITAATLQKGGVALDASTTGLFFKGIEIIWDPTFDEIDTLYGPFTVPFSKRCYFLNSKTIALRPVSGHWMVNRKPERLYDRYVHYYGLTSKYRLTCNKRNANAVLSIA